MALVRTSNNPADWIDIGYASGRVSTHGGRMVGGALVVAPPKPPVTRVAAAGPITPRPSSIPRCGLPMRMQGRGGRPLGEFCARRQGHKPGVCKSAQAVANDNARRRSRDFGKETR
jgi:hypothetical protein